MKKTSTTYRHTHAIFHSRVKKRVSEEEGETEKRRGNPMFSKILRKKPVPHEIDKFLVVLASEGKKSLKKTWQLYMRNDAGDVSGRCFFFLSFCLKRRWGKYLFHIFKAYILLLLDSAARFVFFCFPSKTSFLQPQMSANVENALCKQAGAQWAVELNQLFMTCRCSKTSFT